jgi:hypothetical protein
MDSRDILLGLGLVAGIATGCGAKDDPRPDSESVTYGAGSPDGSGGGETGNDSDGSNDLQIVRDNMWGMYLEGAEGVLLDRYEECQDVIPGEEDSMDAWPDGDTLVLDTTWKLDEDSECDSDRKWVVLTALFEGGCWITADDLLSPDSVQAPVEMDPNGNETLYSVETRFNAYADECDSEDDDGLAFFSVAVAYTVDDDNDITDVEPLNTPMFGCVQYGDFWVEPLGSTARTEDMMLDIQEGVAAEQAGILSK